MKKLLALTLALALCFALAAPAFAADAVVLSPQSLVFDGGAVEGFTAYNINGSNYFKLRDIAALLCGTAGEFAVDGDAEAATVSVTTGGRYVFVGGELESGKDLSATAVPSAQTVLIDGEKCGTLSVYNIGGNNYFKLRDLGEALGFAVDYDAEWNAAVITPPCDAWLMVSEKCTADGVAVTTTYTYDADGRLTGYSAGDGSTSAVYTYNDHGVLVSVKSSGLDLGTGELWEAEYTYTGSGKPLSEVFRSADTLDETYYTYNDRGALIGTRSSSVSGNFASSTECVYDAFGSIVSQTDSWDWGDGTGETSVSTFTRDAQGRTVHSLTRGSGTMEGLDWDENGELISVLEPFSYVSEGDYVYTDTTVTDTGRTVYTYADGSTYVTDVTGVSVYDENGNLLSRKDTAVSDGETITNACFYTYNAAGRCLSETSYFNDAEEPDYVETYTYDAANRMLSDRTDYAGGDYTLMTYTYDADGNCIADSYENRYTEYDWETDSSVTVVEKSSSTYSFDDAGRPVLYTSDDAGEHYERAFTYDANGNLIRETVKENGVVTETYVYTYQRAF